MTQSNQIRKDGISLKVTHFAMLACAMVIILLLVFSTYQTASVFSRLNTATGNYIVRQKAAHDLMEASDYLTEMTQRFTLEGDTQYLDNYFEEAFVNKRREASITSMSENEAEKNLVAQLQDAMDESVSLMYREYYAMRLVIEAKQLRVDQEALRAIELTDEDAFLSPEEQMEKAQNMVMGTEYYQRKETIRNKLKTSLEMLDKQMSSARQSTGSDMNQELVIVRVAIIVLTVAILFLIWMTAYLGTIPLIRAKEEASQGKPVTVQGAKEFRYMARAYNKMREELNGGDGEDAR